MAEEPRVEEEQAEQQEGAQAEGKGQPLSFWLLVGGLVVGLWFAYDEYLVWMWARWSSSEYYNHGFLIPPLSAYLIYRMRGQVAALPNVGNRWGLGVVVLSLVLHALATWKQVNFPSGFALVGTVWGLTMWLWGWPVARALWFPFAFLGFMVPLERLLVEWFSLPMQVASAQGASVMSTLMGIPNVTDGTTINTRDYVFEVAIPCSGLQSVIAMSALGALVGYAVEAVRWKRWVLFAMAFPMAMFGNLTRIFVTIVLGNSIGPAAAEGFFHAVSGVVVFGVAFAGLIAVGGLLGCRNLRTDIL